jgi:apolipoprotein N-acyltransferase
MFSSAFGISGVLFVTSLCGFAIFTIFINHKQRRLLCAVAISVLFLACMYGTCSRIAAQGLFFQQSATVDPAEQRRGLCMIGGSVEGTEKALKSDRDYSFVLWSELSSDYYAPEFDKLLPLSEKAIIGAAFSNSTSMFSSDFYNEAALYSGGQLQYTYKKAHPVPGEASIPGPGIIYSARTVMGRVAMAICFDLCFPLYISSALPRVKKKN